MKLKNNEGFSLVEVLVAIAILAAFVIPTCAGLVLSLRMNEKSKAMMQSQLAVSSAVETMMAEGITSDFVGSLKSQLDETYAQLSSQYNFELKESMKYPEVLLIVSPESSNPVRYYNVTVVSKDGLVEVKTSIRAK